MAVFYRYYLKTSYTKPIHPKVVLGKSWDTGISWYGLIFPSNISFDDWKDEQIKKWEKQNKIIDEGGTLAEVDKCINYDLDKIKKIESSPDFIKWVD